MFQKKNCSAFKKLRHKIFVIRQKWLEIQIWFCSSAFTKFYIPFKNKNVYSNLMVNLICKFFPQNPIQNLLNVTLD